MYSIAIMLVKLSILVFLLRLSPVKSFRWSVYATAFIVIGNYIPSAIISVVSCSPAAKTWDITITDGVCINKPAFYVAGGALNVFTDVVMFFLPLPMVWALQAPSRQKLGVLLVFMTGLL